MFGAGPDWGRPICQDRSGSGSAASRRAFLAWSSSLQSMAGMPLACPLRSGGSPPQVEALARPPDRGRAVLDLLQPQEDLIGLSIRPDADLSAMTAERDGGPVLMLLEERQDVLVEGMAGRDPQLGGIEAPPGGMGATCSVKFRLQGRARLILRLQPDPLPFLRIPRIPLSPSPPDNPLRRHTHPAGRDCR